MAQISSKAQEKVNDTVHTQSEVNHSNEERLSRTTERNSSVSIQPYNSPNFIEQRRQISRTNSLFKNSLTKMKVGFDSITKDIYSIVHWPFPWLTEQRNNNMSPPVYADGELLEIPNIFQNYQQYVRVMKPLVYLELWQYVFESTNSLQDTR